MKVIALLILLSISSWAGEITLAWEPNPEADNVVAYRLYTVSGNQMNKIWEGPTTVSASIQHESPATYVVTAVGGSGLESAPSDPLSVGSFPSSPSGLRILRTRPLR